ncbi:MAG: hypothetical protein IJE41_04460 [Clostridia bacterium]|nr:hypothetical protein [Clostridia bacterium]MBQ6937128.1 hypothetical protein [Clostridia bacterium]
MSDIFTQLPDLNGKTPQEAVRIMENYLRANMQELEYILTHLDSSNIIEIDITKTTIYKGEDNEL